MAKFKVGDPVFYRGAWGTEAPRACLITGIGEKNGRVVYDNDLPHWGYEDQYAAALGVDLITAGMISAAVATPDLDDALAPLMAKARIEAGDCAAQVFDDSWPLLSRAARVRAVVAWLESEHSQQREAFNRVEGVAVTPEKPTTAPPAIEATPLDRLLYESSVLRAVLRALFEYVNANSERIVNATGELPTHNALLDDAKAALDEASKDATVVEHPLAKLARNMADRMREIDSLKDRYGEALPPTGETYNSLWDAILDEFKAAGVDLVPMLEGASETIPAPKGEYTALGVLREIYGWWRRHRDENMPTQIEYMAAQVLGETPLADLLHPFTVSLHEDKGDKHTIIFECQAEDADHAAEQAMDAYPRGEVLNCTKTD
jgi:hypothetical protein